MIVAGLGCIQIHASDCAVTAAMPSNSMYGTPILLLCHGSSTEKVQGVVLSIVCVYVCCFAALGLMLVIAGLLLAVG